MKVFAPRFAGSNLVSLAGEAFPAGLYYLFYGYIPSFSALLTTLSCLVFLAATTPLWADLRGWRAACWMGGYVVASLIVSFAVFLHYLDHIFGSR
jgi:hypothetical protein